MKPRQTKARDFKRLLRRMGFYEHSQAGSHKKFRHPDGRMVVVPDHPGDLAVGTLRSMIDSIGMTVEEFNESI